MSRSSGYEDHLGHSVKRLYHLMGQHFNEVLRPYGVARSQWYMLYHIQQSGGLTQKELQDLLQVESATLTGALNALEQKGWVVRQPGTADRRVKALKLTSAGKKLWAALPDPILEIRRRMLKGISPREEEVARKILEKAIQNLESAA
ncbi:MAG TPA: MarR family transcriptional regulator [Anaerolineales bacterium]|nr:MarR family transcriptional regulator [Anaerolineales bacterium]